MPISIEAESGPQDAVEPMGGLTIDRLRYRE